MIKKKKFNLALNNVDLVFLRTLRKERDAETALCKIKKMQ